MVLRQTDDLGRLILRVALRDRRAFERIYAATSPRLFAVTLKIARDPSEAEDILHEAYVRIWHRAASYAPESGSAMGWLVTQTRNLAIDIVRAEPRAVGDPGPTHVGAAENGLNGGTERELIERCLASLDEDKARALRDAYILGWSYKDLADRHRTPINTMRTWLRGSLVALKRCLET